MAAQTLRVVLSQLSLFDLDEVVAYWTEREEPERGEQYARDLYAEAKRALADAAIARAGRFLRGSKHRDVRELLVFKRSYRIVYRIDDVEGTVEVLRFWHSHRDEPFRE